MFMFLNFFSGLTIYFYSNLDSPDLISYGLNFNLAEVTISN